MPATSTSAESFPRAVIALKHRVTGRGRLVALVRQSPENASGSNDRSATPGRAPPKSRSKPSPSIKVDHPVYAGKRRERAGLDDVGNRQAPEQGACHHWRTNSSVVPRPRSAQGRRQIGRRQEPGSFGEHRQVELFSRAQSMAMS